MACRIVSEYISKLKTAGHPTMVSGNQVVSGRVVLTVELSLDLGERFGIQVPGDFDLKENLCLPLFLSLVLESESEWWPVWLQISETVAKTGLFEGDVKGWKVTAEPLGKDLALNFERKRAA